MLLLLGACKFLPFLPFFKTFKLIPYLYFYLVLKIWISFLSRQPLQMRKIFCSCLVVVQLKRQRGYAAGVFHTSDHQNVGGRVSGGG